ncbi:MAG: class I mannose-6-phosphate isomerase [Flavobacteriaceae bacterium]|nr:class I mannose-6-phosphate isomerase [Flavobacteriaceae bacterium]
MERLYPLKFTPQFFHRLWGGNNLEELFGIFPSSEKWGEAWLISTMKGFPSQVAKGPLKGFHLDELIRQYKSDLVGKKIYNRWSDSFPLLVKLIDASEDLSIQVHPDNELASKKHRTIGKSEMWYILRADKSSFILDGFTEKYDSESLMKFVSQGVLKEKMNSILCHRGQVHYIPAGRPHAIGGGILLAEIQQASDITYRLYDYNRLDSKTNQKRELHLDLGLKAINYGSSHQNPISYFKKINRPNKLVQSPFFSTNFIPIRGEVLIDYSKEDRFYILICVGGQLSLRVNKNNYKYTLDLGEALLIPACFDSVLIDSKDAQVLEVSVPE